MNPIIQFDRILFEKINLDWTNAVFDVFFPAITDLHRSPWFLSMVFILLGLWIFKKRIQGTKWIAILVCAVGLSDLISYRVIKSNIQRDRPQFADVMVQLRTHQHTGTSFPSNHAANIFAAASVLSFAFRRWWPVFFVIAAAVAYSRVYVGVHFPLDVTAGALLGSLIALTLRVGLSGWLKRSSEAPKAPSAETAESKRPVQDR